MKTIQVGDELHLKVDKKQIHLEGVLNESIDTQKLKDALEKVLASQRVRLDVGSLHRGNSVGLHEFSKFVNSTEAEFVFAGCRPWFLQSLAVMDMSQTKIESFYVTYANENIFTDRLFEVGKDIDLEGDPAAFNLPSITMDGRVYEATIAEDEIWDLIVWCMRERDLQDDAS